MRRMPLSLPVGQYLPTGSVLHRLDPRLKLSATLAFVVGLFLTAGWTGLLMLGAAATTVLLVARVPPRYVWRAARPLAALLVLTFLLQMFAYPGTALAELGPLTITTEGLERSAYLTFRVGLLVAAGGLLTSTTDPVSLLAAMEWFLAPLSRVGLPGRELALTMSLALRFIPVLHRQMEDLLKAQHTRGITVWSRDPRRVVRTIFPLLVPLFVQGFRQAERISTAMLSRGYHGGEGRTRYRVLRMGRSDWVTLGAGSAWLAMAVTVGRFWGW